MSSCNCKSISGVLGADTLFCGLAPSPFSSVIILFPLVWELPLYDVSAMIDLIERKVCVLLHSFWASAGWTHFWAQARNIVYCRERERARESACSALFAGRLPCRVKLIQIKECVGCLAGWNAVRVSTWQGGSRFFSTRKPVCDSAATQTLTHTKPPPIPLHLSFTTCHTVNDSYITYHRVSWRPWSYLQVYLWNLSSLSLSFVCLRVCALSGQDVPRHISQIDL